MKVKYYSFFTYSYYYQFNLLTIKEKLTSESMIIRLHYLYVDYKIILSNRIQTTASLTCFLLTIKICDL